MFMMMMIIRRKNSE